MSRVKELDILKSFIITVSMIGIHSLYHLADYDALSPSAACNVLNILATAWCAPVFMFCMGISLGFSRHSTPSDWLRRGVHLLTVGMALNVLRYGPLAYRAYAMGEPDITGGLAQIFNVDILQFAGLAFMLLALLKHLNMSARGILVLSVLMNVAGTLLIGLHTSSYAVDQILGYFCHTPTCSCFPLLNWFVFVAAGNMMGKIYRGSDNIDRAFRFIIPVCGVIAIVHQYLSITGCSPLFKTLENDWEYYSMATPDALCIAFGVAPFMVGVFRLLGKLVPDSWMEALSYPSRHINQYYCVPWVWIMWIHCFLWRIEPAATVAVFVLIWTLIVALTTVTVLLYNKFLANKGVPPFQWSRNRLDRRSMGAVHHIRDSIFHLRPRAVYNAILGRFVIPSIRTSHRQG